MGAVVVEVVSAEAHRCGGRNVAGGDHRPGDRCQSAEQLLDFGVVERRQSAQR
jgi:hypothetical protein